MKQGERKARSTFHLVRILRGYGWAAVTQGDVLSSHGRRGYARCYPIAFAEATPLGPVRNCYEKGAEERGCRILADGLYQIPSGCSATWLVTRWLLRPTLRHIFFLSYISPVCTALSFHGQSSGGIFGYTLKFLTLWLPFWSTTVRQLTRETIAGVGASKRQSTPDFAGSGGVFPYAPFTV